jgi:hypothetical protein
MKSHDASEMYFGDIVLAFQKTVVLHPEVELNRQSLIGTKLGVF